MSTARHEQLKAAEGKRQNLLRRELEWLRRGPKARGTKQKARKARIAELQKIDDDRVARISINLAGRRLGKKVLQVEQIGKTFEPHSLFQNVDFTLGQGDRIGLIGPNATGKSTFLNILAGQVTPDTGHVTWGETVHLGYYDQQSSALIDSMRAIDFIEQEAPLIKTRDGGYMSAFQVLEWFLFPKAQQYAQIGSLSGGERRRLYLLYILMHQPNVLLLDEPTNDLDIPTLTRLEEFLDHFQGSLVVASHDRYFLDRTVDYLVSFEHGQIGPRYPAPYSTYQQLRYEESRQRIQSDRPDSGPTGKSSRSKSRPPKLTWKEQRELDQIEGDIADLETEKEKLAVAINTSGNDYAKLQKLADQLQVVDQTGGHDGALA
jgi:ATP-binding cassette subfamily F protein uup